MNQKHSILKFEVISTIFIILVGSLLHFTYDWSNQNPFVGAFSAVNESVWEHLKILFFPFLLTTIIGYFYTKPLTNNYLSAKTKGILLALSFIVVFFYTYTGIIGTHFPIVDIISFIVAIIIGEYYTYKNIQLDSLSNKLTYVIILIILCLSFIIFTFKTPHIGIFKDSVTNTYGIQKAKS